jgi:large subunit ribosomal protein L17
MYRNMVTSLMVHGQIKTTEAKAKELRRIADKIITMGKRVPPSSLEGLKGEELKAAQARRLHFIRRVRRWVNSPEAIERLFGEYAERFAKRPGGYTRILKTGFRSGDDAPMALIQLVGDFSESDAKPKKAAVAPEPVEEAAEAPVEAADATVEAAEAPAETVDEAPAADAAEAEESSGEQ